MFLEFLYEPDGTEFKNEPYYSLYCSPDEYEFEPYDLVDFTKMLVLADKYGSLPVEHKTMNVIEQRSKESRLTPKEIAESLKLVYDPAMSNVNLPKILHQTLLLETMHKPNVHGHNRFTNYMGVTLDTKEGDFLWMMNSCTEYSYFSGSCEKLIYSDKEIPSAKCPGCGYYKLKKPSGSLVLADESLLD